MSENGKPELIDVTIQEQRQDPVAVMGDAECTWDFKRVDYRWSRRFVRAYSEFTRANLTDDLDKFEAIQDALYGFILDVLVSVPEHWLNHSAPPAEEIDWSDFESLAYLQPQYFGRLLSDIQTAMSQAAKA